MQDEYTPPKVWTQDSENGGAFANINRPVSGATHEKELPVGKHPFQLYSLATPNGQKVTILFEELLQAGHSGAEYDAFPVRIRDGEQFSSGFVAINPNSKIPALVDRSANPPLRIFESGAILLYLAEKFDAFLPKERVARVEAMNWLFWQMASAPYIGGGFGHFFSYAPMKIKYAIDRFTMETKRLLDVLDKRLGEHRYLAGTEYSIADIANWPWYGRLVRGELYEGSAEFLDVGIYKNVKRWADEIAKRPAVVRGQVVNRITGPEEGRMPERHSSEDFAKFGFA